MTTIGGGGAERPSSSFAGLSDAEWNLLAGERFYSTAAWQRYCTAETNTAGDVVLVRDRAGDVAWAAPVRELSGLAGWSSYRWNDQLARAGLPELAPHGILVGPAEGFQTHLLPGHSRDLAALAEFIDAVRDRCGRGQRSAVAMFLDTANARLLVDAGVAHVPVLLDADAWLPIPAGGWDEYLATFGKKRRHTIRAERRKFADADLVVTHAALADCWQHLGQASASLLRKYGDDATSEEELACMRRVLDALGNRARVAVCHSADAFERPSGFCIYYEHRDTVFLRWAGFDDTRLRGVYEYFNTVYYTQIDRAAATGARWIHAGPSATQAKALRGAQLRPSWLVDLTAGSPLSEASGRIEEHNARMLAAVRADPSTANAIACPDEWTAFA
ncbi:MAG: GNAT family N-acetyltransferase [Mycobacteriaceae bacterium]|nr:GNAT family N-acetyltransferase [Mycobacteriaceae bacterium]